MLCIRHVKPELYTRLGIRPQPLALALRLRSLQSCCEWLLSVLEWRGRAGQLFGLLPNSVGLPLELARAALWCRNPGAWRNTTKSDSTLMSKRLAGFTFAALRRVFWADS